MEAHIEQGSASSPAQFELTVTGEPSRIGPTTMDRRREMLPILRVHCDVRHEDGLGAQAMEQELRAAIDRISERRGVRVEIDPYATSGPVSSEGKLGTLVRIKHHHNGDARLSAGAASC